MLKIRRPLGRLIFNMGIAIPGKTVFLIETAPWWPDNTKSHGISRHGRADSRLASSQWEMLLQSNAISHWLGTNLESALCGIYLICAQNIMYCVNMDNFNLTIHFMHTASMIPWDLSVFFGTQFLFPCKTTKIEENSMNISHRNPQQPTQAQTYW